MKGEGFLAAGGGLESSGPLGSVDVSGESAGSVDVLVEFVSSEDESFSLHETVISPRARKMARERILRRKLGIIGVGPAGIRDEKMGQEGQLDYALQKLNPELAITVCRRENGLFSCYR